MMSLDRNSSGCGVLGLAGRAQALCCVMASLLALPGTVGADALRSWQSAELLHELRLEEGPAEHLAFSTSGDRLAGAGRDGKWLKVWDTTSGRLVHSLAGHMARDLEASLPVTDLAFDPRGRYLITSSWNPGLIPDASLILWDLAEGDAVHRLAGVQGCHEVVFEAEGDGVWAACGPDAQRYSVADGNMTERREGIPAALTDDARQMPSSEDLPMPRQGPADAVTLHLESGRLAWAGKPPTHTTPRHCCVSGKPRRKMRDTGVALGRHMTPCHCRIAWRLAIHWG